jgi:hypothetical protein
VTGHSQPISNSLQAQFLGQRILNTRNTIQPLKTEFRINVFKDNDIYNPKTFHFKYLINRLIIATEYYYRKRHNKKCSPDRRTIIHLAGESHCEIFYIN